MPRYAELVYNGFWFSPERLALQDLVDRTQRYCTGMVRLKLYKVRVWRWVKRSGGGSVCELTRSGGRLNKGARGVTARHGAPEAA